MAFKRKPGPNLTTHVSAFFLFWEISKNSKEDKKKSHLKGNICRSHWSPDSVWNNKIQDFRINSTIIEMTLTFAQKRKKTCLRLSSIICIDYNADDFYMGQVQGVWESGAPADQRESNTWSRETCLSGWVGAGTRAVTSTARWSGARAAACWGPPPWGAGPVRKKKI